jgi:hypothetical protein
MRRLCFVAILLVGWPSPTVVTSPETGSIQGRVLLTSKVRGNPLPTTAYSPRAIERYEPKAAPEIQNVLVYLRDVVYRGTLPPTPREIVQEHESFVPRVAAVTKGSTVSFPNADPIFHNVFSLSGTGPFDLGRYPSPQTRTRTFIRSGLVKVFCHIHSQMSASIVVFDHPFFAAPDGTGTFVLRDIPPGQYTIVGWHERIGERSRPIEVTAGQSVDVTLSLPVEELR